MSKAEEMLAKALEMEQKGRDYFSRIVSTCASGLGKEMFKMILDDENEHIARIKAIFESLTEGKGWTDELVNFSTNVDDIEEFFDKLESRRDDVAGACADDVEAVKMGRDFERATVEFYEQKLEDAVDPLEREFIKRMIDEEKAHYRALDELYTYFTDPDSWFMEKQGFKMDSG